MHGVKQEKLNAVANLVLSVGVLCFYSKSTGPPVALIRNTPAVIGSRVVYWKTDTSMDLPYLKPISLKCPDLLKPNLWSILGNHSAGASATQKVPEGPSCPPMGSG